MKPVDIGEAWAAVLGIEPVLSKRVEKITDGQRAEVARIHETIAKRAGSLVRGGIAPANVDLVDCMKILRETSGAMDVPQIEAMIAPLPDGEQLAYMTVARRSYLLLQSAVPKATYKTFSGGENMPPDFPAQVELSELFAALTDPVAYVFGAIADGSMPRGLAESIRGVFPTLCEAITLAITAANTEMLAKSKGHQLPDAAEIGMAAWSLTPIESPVPSPKPEPPDDSEESDDSGGDLGKVALTPAEQIEAQ